MLTGLLFGQDVVTIELKNGDKISGQVVSETESQITVKTNFGNLDIPKVNIAFIEREITENTNSVNQNFPIELNQEARWRTIWSSMALGNSLYGWRDEEWNTEYLQEYVKSAIPRETMCFQSLGMQFSTLVLPLELDDEFRLSCL